MLILGPRESVASGVGPDRKNYPLIVGGSKDKHAKGIYLTILEYRNRIEGGIKRAKNGMLFCTYYIGNCAYSLYIICTSYYIPY